MYKGKWLSVDNAEVRFQSDGLLIKIRKDTNSIHIPLSVMEKLREQEWESDQLESRRNK